MAARRAASRTCGCFRKPPIASWSSRCRAAPTRPGSSCSVEAPNDDPDALFEQAQAAEEAGDDATAERLYRRVMKLDPGDPAAPFNLANLLRAGGRTVEAEAAYREAVKADPGFAEAWYNLADVLDEQGRSDRGDRCLKRAIEADPDYADAMFNLALLLQRLERHAEAAPGGGAISSSTQTRPGPRGPSAR